MPQLFFEGPPALSAFRRAALLARCRQAVTSVQSVAAHYLYMARIESRPDAETRQRLATLLGVAGPGADEYHGDANALLVTPRPGTISPWSTKATDIVRNCGLDIDRVERGVRYRFGGGSGEALTPLRPLLHDRMTEAVVDDPAALFQRYEPRPLRAVPLLRDGREALAEANARWGLALPDEELDYLADAYARLGRDPTDVELVMFANVNSEHCRHKIFNAEWIVDGTAQEHSLFDMIRNTHARHPEFTVKAYSDNSGVIEGYPAAVF